MEERKKRERGFFGGSENIDCLGSNTEEMGNQETSRNVREKHGVRGLVDGNRRKKQRERI